GLADAAVDADDLAVHVEERAAGVAAHQRAVGADDRVARIEHAAEPDDRGTPGLVSAGMADGHAPVALRQLAGLAHLDERIVALIADLDESAVDAAVASEGLALELAAIGEQDLGVAAGRAGDVAGGEHVAVLRDDDAAARSAADAQADRGGLQLLDQLLHV